MAWRDLDIGAVSAYAIAVEHGYTGTEEEWANEQAAAGTNARIAKESAESAKSSAQNAIKTLEAIEEASTNLIEAIETAGATQISNVQSEGATQISSVKDAGNEQSRALSAQGDVEQRKVIAAGDEQVSRVTNAGNDAVESVTLEKTNAINSVQSTKVEAVNSVETAKTSAVDAVKSAESAAIQNIGTGVDDTLSISGKAADAKKTGDSISSLKDDLGEVVDYYYPKNLYNPVGNTVGYYMEASNGVPAVSENAFYTDYIPVQYGKKIVVSLKNSAGNRTLYPIRRICFYDSNKNYLSGANSVNQYDVPQSAEYAILSWNTLPETLNDFQVELNESGEHTTYESYFEPYIKIKDEALYSPYLLDDKKTVEKAKTFIKTVISENLLNCDNVQSGYLVANGKIAPNDNFRTSEFIEVDSGDVIYAYYRNAKSSGIYALNSNDFWCAYDSDYNMVADSYIKNSGSYNVPINAKYIRFSYNINTGVEFMLSKGSASKYKPYFEPYDVVDGNFVTEKGKTLHAFLPPYIPIALGRTIELYNNQVCLEADSYHIQWDSNVGIAYKDKLSISATATGTTEIKFNVFDDENNLILSKTTNIIVFDGTMQDTVSVNPIGDSLTYNKIWLGEVERLSDNKIAFVGTSEFSFDINGGIYSGGHNGVSGYSSGDVWHKNEVNNKYYDPSVSHFDWSYYKTQNGFNPNAVQIFLGMNVLEYENISTLYFINQIIDNIRSYDAEIPIFLVMPQYKGDQNGIGSQLNNQGYVSANGRYKYGEDLKTYDLMTRLYDTYKDSSHIYFIPIALTHDSAHNYSAQSIKANPRSEEMITVQNESVHPTESGYLQFADMIYSAISYVMLNLEI